MKSVVCSAVWLALGLVLAACGSSNNPTTAGPPAASGRSALVKFSACVRSHGVPGFPDPSTSETPNSFGIDGYNFDLPAGLNLESPAYQSAERACEHLITGGSGASHDFNVARARQVALAHAECMRRHGVPNFPDPTVSGGAQGITVASGGRGIDPRSPAFQRAQKLCAPR